MTNFVSQDYATGAIPYRLHACGRFLAGRPLFHPRHHALDGNVKVHGRDLRKLFHQRLPPRDVGDAVQVGYLTNHLARVTK